MAKRNEDVHPNVLVALARPEAKRLAHDHTAARKRRFEIGRMYDNGAKVNDIAAHFGISRVRVYQLLRARGLRSTGPW